MAGAHYPRQTASGLVPLSMEHIVASSIIRAGQQVVEITGSEGKVNGETPDQTEAWIAYRKIPEVKTLVQGTANLLAQCRLFVGRREWSNGHEVDVPARDPKTGVADPFLGEELVAAAEDALGRHVDVNGVQSGLIRGLSIGMQVVGESRIVGYYVDDQGVPTTNTATSEERWVACGPGAIVKQSDIRGDYWELKLTRARTLRLPVALVHRFDWPGGEFPDEPSAWVIGSLDVCRDLRSFTMALRAAARSAIAAALMLVPTEASPQAVNPGGWGPGEEGAIVTAQQAADEWAAKVENLVAEFMVGALENNNSGQTMYPGVLAVEGRFIEQFKTMSFARMIDRGIAELVRDARLRLAAAADCAPEMLKGLGQTNRWNGAQIADDEYRRYYKPHADSVSDQWTRSLLWPDLKGRGFPPATFRKIRALVDSSAVVADPDWSTIAPVALAGGAIGAAGFRQLLRIPESAAPTAEEQALFEKTKTAPTNNGSGQGDTGSPDGANPVDTSKGSTTTSVPTGSRLVAAAGNDLADRLAQIELTTRARLQEACEAALDKALDKGVAHLRNWARKDKAFTAPPTNEAFLLVLGDRAGPLADANTKNRREELFAVALTALLLRWRAVAAAAFASALLVAGKTLPQAEVDAAIERSVGVLRDSMMELADERLFGIPHGPTPGEQTGLRVPSPLIQRVMAAAGGAPGVGGGITALFDAVMGFVFGPLLGRVLPVRQGLTWVYGDPAERQQPFPQHEDLDGLEFTDWNDPRLAGSIFGGYSFVGDHQGCRCLAVPRY